MLVPELGAAGAPGSAPLGKYSISSYRHLAKGKSLPQSAYRFNATQMYLYFYKTSSASRWWERSVLGGDKEHKLLCCNFYSCFLFNGTNCILCKGASGPRGSDGLVQTRQLSPTFFSLFFVGHTEAVMPRNARLLARSFFNWFAVRCHCKFVSRATCQMSVQIKTKNNNKNNSKLSGSNNLKI